MQFYPEHFGLASADPTALSQWYVSHLDAKIVFALESESPAYFAELPGGFVIEIYKAAAPAAAPSNNRDAGWRHLALQVESLQTTADALKARHVEFETEIKKAAGGGQILFFRDLDGNLLHLVERPKGALFSK